MVVSVDLQGQRVHSLQAGRLRHVGDKGRAIAFAADQLMYIQLVELHCLRLRTGLATGESAKFAAHLEFVPPRCAGLKLLADHVG